MEELLRDVEKANEDIQGLFDELDGAMKNIKQLHGGLEQETPL